MHRHAQRSHAGGPSASAPRRRTPPRRRDVPGDRVGPRGRDERGVSLSVLVVALIPMLLVVVGFVVDQAARVSAARTASVVAAQAARAGSDASAADRLAGGTGAASGVRAAQQVLAAHGVAGEVTLRQGRLVVTAHTRSDTMFLSLLGVDHFDLSSTVTSELVRA